MRLVFAIVTALLAGFAHEVHAQLSVSAGIESFHWEEATTPVVEEDGLLLALGVAYTQKKEAGAVWAYRGRFWTGEVDYNGSTLFTNQPLTGTTAYTGVVNEGQLRWRKPLRNADYQRDFVLGFGVDRWRRELSSVQYEDYTVIYTRAGLEVESASPRSWQFAFGAKYPLQVYEDAHLTNIGFDSNPELNPGGKVSAYAELGYRLDRQWRLTAYLDGYRFSRSNEVHVTEIVNGLGDRTVFQPPSDMLIVGIKLQWEAH